MRQTEKQHELSIFDPNERPRLRVRTVSPVTEEQPWTYYAIYIVRYVHGDTTNYMDFDQIGGRFDSREDALRFAKALLSDRVLLSRLHTVNKPDALLVNDQDGVHVVPPFALNETEPAPERDWRRVSWFWRMLGYKG